MGDDLLVRALATLAAAMVVITGCGASKAPHRAKPQVRGDSYTVVLKPAGPLGHWAKLLLSPDNKTWLAQWSGECEVQTAYFIPARGGKLRPVTGHASDESIALGWARHNRARILVPRAACGSQFRRPGVYLVDRQGHATFAKAVKARPGGS
jgi:hypothetical protein